VDDFWITLRGQGGHAAYPHDTVDPIRPPAPWWARSRPSRPATPTR
jgi:hypothetical protein